jgi:hypothetical protein
MKQGHGPQEGRKKMEFRNAQPVIYTRKEGSRRHSALRHEAIFVQYRNMAHTFASIHIPAYIFDNGNIGPKTMTVKVSSLEAVELPTPAQKAKVEELANWYGEPGVEDFDRTGGMEIDFSPEDGRRYTFYIYLDGKSVQTN